MIQNARIERTELGIEDHGFLTLWLFLDYGGVGQGFGGFILDDKPVDGEHERQPHAVCGAMIVGILRTVGVERWEDLPGRYVRVSSGDDGRLQGLGNILNDVWFKPVELVDALKRERS